MDPLTALIAGMQYRDTAPPEDPIHRVSDHRLLELIQNHLQPRPKTTTRTTPYADPTGQQAAARADRKPRWTKTP